MATFEEQDEVATTAWPVIGKATINDDFVFIGIYPNEETANLVASQKVLAPDNWAMARVCSPTGNLFKDTE